MAADDHFRSDLDSTIAVLRYWAPTIADLATLHDEEWNGFWRLSARPHVSGACAFSIQLSDNGTCELTLDGQTFAELSGAPSEFYVALLEAVTSGCLVRRYWRRSSTAFAYGSETIVTLANGQVWKAGSEVAESDGLEYRDHAFLPYRRDANDHLWL